jgi:signal transduction histidine kinase
VSPLGVFRWDGREFKQFPVDQRPGATAVYMGLDNQGRVLTYYGYGNLMRMEESGPTMLWRFEDLSIGYVNTVLAAPDYMLIAGESGIARHDHRGFRTLSGTDYPFLREVSGFVQTETGHTWLISRSGIVRLSTRELEARFDDPGAPLNFRIFDNEDGLTDTADVPGWDMARQGPDGRLWFSTNNGIFSLDPSRLRRNDVPPPVVIRSVVANGVRHEFSPSLDLGSGVRNLQVDFTAPSLSRPSRVQFRYRLAGVDEDWVDPGTRRQAIYTNLSPGEYQFQVMAANEDGVWNPEAAVLELSVPPTFIQSRLFLVLCIAATGLLLWLLYKLRLRQVAGRIRERLEARQRERERIARELHDTLLQSVQGLILKVQAASEDIPDEAPARAQIVRALDEADQVLVEGRDRVRGLRATEHAGGLADAMSEAAERLVGGTPANWTLTEQGTARALKPVAAEEVSRIAEEALFNSHRHAEAKQIDLTISYGPKALFVAIKDDGKGIDPEVLTKGERTGHFGLPGMRERAERLGGRVQVDSAPGAGTRIEVTIPAKAAYVDHRRGSRSRRKRESEDA